MYKMAYACDYTIKNTFTKLEEEINTLMKEGYRPHGSVTFFKNNDGTYIAAQPMVK